MTQPLELLTDSAEELALLSFKSKLCIMVVETLREIYNVDLPLVEDVDRDFNINAKVLENVIEGQVTLVSIEELIKLVYGLHFELEVSFDAKLMKVSMQLH